MPRTTRCATSRLTTAQVAASRTLMPSMATSLDKAVKIAIGRSPSGSAMPRHLSMSALPSMVPPPSMRTPVVLSAYTSARLQLASSVLRIGGLSSG